ncbi:hypothetical protein H310_11410 [Aphanomyces invadans]|uniref:Uncharacterized protein n=1 Tax=Aphanomyces invadans TaxID=157072 RepID=A0A024TP47_9STRA|nr:hypothetical protein H310_11410 [Aphanomyces invadans]ETV95142.1 hypothetical protein H310_11410 [Aphanomyces invadans]|eukprot:XP_008876315.1 hypothetical protein H310_11410 [Aphanomyces invadans]
MSKRARLPARVGVLHEPRHDQHVRNQHSHERLHRQMLVQTRNCTPRLRMTWRSSGLRQCWRPAKSAMMRPTGTCVKFTAMFHSGVAGDRDRPRAAPSCGISHRFANGRRVHHDGPAGRERHGAPKEERAAAAPLARARIGQDPRWTGRRGSQTLARLVAQLGRPTWTKEFQAAVRVPPTAQPRPCSWPF